MRDNIARASVSGFGVLHLLLISKDACNSCSYGEHYVRVKNPTPAFLLPARRYEQDDLNHIIRDVLHRDSRTCQMCGADESCRCPYNNKQISLFIRIIKPEAEGGMPDVTNLRTICSTCADGLRSAARADKGLQNAAPIKPDRLQLLVQVRRATIDDQKDDPAGSCRSDLSAGSN